jgi:hypothetical protein
MLLLAHPLAQSNYGDNRDIHLELLKILGIYGQLSCSEQHWF